MSEHNLRHEKAKLEIIAVSRHHPAVNVVRFLPNGLFGLEMELSIPNLDDYLNFHEELYLSDLRSSMIMSRKAEGQYWLRVEVEVPQNWQTPEQTAKTESI